MRILIDPDALRVMASRMRGAATLLSSTARRLRSRELPAMPVAVSTFIAESLARANAELDDLAAGLVRDAGNLYARAAWAEADLGRRSLWTALGEQQAHPLVDIPGGGAADADLEAAQAWSRGLLESSSDAAAAADAPGPDVTELRNLVESDLAGMSQQLSALPSPSLTLGDEPGFDGGRGFSADAASATGAGGAALGNALGEIAESPTGVGILGCITVGGGFDAVDEGGGDSG